jgi:hypothetical protein
MLVEAAIVGPAVSSLVEEVSLPHADIEITTPTATTMGVGSRIMSP